MYFIIYEQNRGRYISKYEAYSDEHPLLWQEKIRKAYDDIDMRILFYDKIPDEVAILLGVNNES